MATTDTFGPVVQDGIYNAKGGDGRLAERDRYVQLYLTAKGAKLYKDAVRAYQVSGDEAQLERDVRKAAAAGY